MKPLLLIEDDAYFSRTLSRVLTREGFSVTAVADADMVPQLLAQKVPDYAIVDLKLEESSGLDLIEPLRQANAQMRILILTGYASIATTVEAIKRGADDYLTKPLDMKLLLAALGEAPPAEVKIPNEPMSLRRLEWEHIQRVLNENDGNITAAARALGMHRRTLQRRLAKRPVRESDPLPS